MRFRKIIYGGIGVGFISILLCCVVIYHIAHFDCTTVAFLDIGQGDAILISRGSQQILIDGGPDSTVLLEQLGTHMPFWDRTIEIVVATHPDSDHIDGLVGVFKNYSVGQFWHTNAGKNTSVYKALINEAKNEKDVKDLIAWHGLSAIINDDARLEVIYPFTHNVDNIEDANDTSITTVLSVANEKFYFGGDLTSKVEDILPIDEEITVLKAGHHGSHLSTSDDFLDKTAPRDVIVSVGEGNRYGHPHGDVIERVLSHDAQIFRTDEQGTIVYQCRSNVCKMLTK